jgi:hypothetical protein
MCITIEAEARVYILNPKSFQGSPYVRLWHPDALLEKHEVLIYGIEFITSNDTRGTYFTDNDGLLQLEVGATYTLERPRVAVMNERGPYGMY